VTGRGRSGRFASDVAVAAGPAVSVVLPARDEAGQIGAVLGRIFATVRTPCEVIVVVDTDSDPTHAVVQRIAASEPRLHCLVGQYGPGPASAIRYGIDRAHGPVVVVTMADDSDDVRQVDRLVALVRAGAVVAAASRYSRGGRQVGGPVVKGLMSRAAGLSLRLFAGAGTADATNSFKAYSAAFVREVGIDSRQGFAIGIELTAKARRLRRPVAEIPTTWRARADGQSGFRLVAWLPCYLRWYLLCFGRPLTVAELKAACAGRVVTASRQAAPGALP